MDPFRLPDCPTCNDRGVIDRGVGGGPDARRAYEPCPACGGVCRRRSPGQSGPPSPPRDPRAATRGFLRLEAANLAAYLAACGTATAFVLLWMGPLFDWVIALDPRNVESLAAIHLTGFVLLLVGQLFLMLFGYNSVGSVRDGLFRLWLDGVKSLDDTRRRTIVRRCGRVVGLATLAPAVAYAVVGHYQITTIVLLVLFGYLYVASCRDSHAY